MVVFIIYYKWVRCEMGEGGSGLYIDCEKMRNKVLGCDGMCVGVGSLTEASEIKKMGEIKGCVQPPL